MPADTRQVLNRDLIATTALRLTDNDGLDGLSMRKLGAELGVEAMSLYHYVASKDDLLDAIVELLFAEVELPPDSGSSDTFCWERWKSDVRQTLTSFHDVLMRHPAAVELITHRSITGPNGLELLYWSYRRCAQLGLGSSEASQAFHLCVGYVLGRAASEIGVLGRPRDEVAAVEEVVKDQDLRDFMASSREIDREVLFQIGLDTMFAGFITTFQLDIID